MQSRSSPHLPVGPQTGPRFGRLNSVYDFAPKNLIFSWPLPWRRSLPSFFPLSSGDRLIIPKMASEEGRVAGRRRASQKQWMTKRRNGLCVSLPLCLSFHVHSSQLYPLHDDIYRSLPKIGTINYEKAIDSERRRWTDGRRERADLWLGCSLLCEGMKCIEKEKCISADLLRIEATINQRSEATSVASYCVAR